MIPNKYQYILKFPTIIDGWEAYQHGLELNDCPYSFDTDDEFDWRRGWKLADKLFKEIPTHQ
jgi:hypothetical protein